MIGGTLYAGEIKKSVFSILNYLLPERNVLPMHCSANIGPSGDTAIFFGLSGTGKTTLSADSTRTLIGDDEHGWSDNGVFNFEGGCYAKVIRLSPEAEPEIFATTRRYGTILENVVMDPASRRLDLDDGRYTENTRASYPLDFIPNCSENGMGDQPVNIVMLTADAFGVLPPIAKLTPEQAMYHFLSGYTAKVAGTEKGLGNAPQATFSTCFGAPFMPQHPSVYAEMLGQRIGVPDGIEGRPGNAPGLGLLDVETELSVGKTLTRVAGTEPASGEPVAGYEMHIGRTTGPDTGRPMLDLETGADGAISADGRVRGCYVHGLFAKDPFRHAFLSRLKNRRASGLAYEEELDQVLDGLADHLEAHLQVDRILQIAGVR